MAVEKIFLISKFNDELISSFIEFLNDSEGSKHLVMDSVGGNLDAMNLILSIVNDNPDQYTSGRIEEAFTINYFNFNCCT